MRQDDEALDTQQQPVRIRLDTYRPEESRRIDIKTRRSDYLPSKNDVMTPNAIRPILKEGRHKHRLTQSHNRHGHSNRGRSLLHLRTFRSFRQSTGLGGLQMPNPSRHSI